eukprot:TRINITY_DN2742_c0_g1_i5.p1 TRINITY_DN2742_c0_g1~~TRINITY_DN2742_c0_g1_i5.p1  ORF type:complete len:188 (-),score=21.56 TRINITY_DN2742_c0_g1_i5:106-669(-)
MGILFFGQSLLAISTLGPFWFACIARFFVGLGGKNISLSRITYSSDWFVGQELAFAFALATGISRLGSISAMALSPNLYKWTQSLSFTFWFADIFVLLSCICGLAAILIDQHVVNKTKYVRSQKSFKEISLSDIKDLGIGYWLIMITIGTWYLSFNCFVYISNKYAQDRFGLSLIEAGYLAVLLCES